MEKNQYFFDVIKEMSVSEIELFYSGYDFDEDSRNSFCSELSNYIQGGISNATDLKQLEKISQLQHFQAYVLGLLPPD